MRSLPCDHDSASSTKLIRLDGLKRSNLFERGTVGYMNWLVWYAGSGASLISHLLGVRDSISQSALAAALPNASADSALVRVFFR